MIFQYYLKCICDLIHKAKKKTISLSGLLTELDLVRNSSKGKDEFFIIENNERPEIPRCKSSCTLSLPMISMMYRLT